MTFMSFLFFSRPAQITTAARGCELRSSAHPDQSQLKDLHPPPGSLQVRRIQSPLPSSGESAENVERRPGGITDPPFSKCIHTPAMDYGSSLILRTVQFVFLRARLLIH